MFGNHSSAVSATEGKVMTATLLPFTYGCLLLQTNCTLKTLNLSFNGFSDDGAVALGEAIRANNTLTELDVR